MSATDLEIRARAAARRWPVSTYRLQFHAGFTFRDALKIVPYLDDLGITDIYASPILKATPGSMHGYDVIDHHVLNPELGGEEDFTALSDALHARGMQMIVDIVPNHMGVGSNDNAWWNDCLENGPLGPHGNYFDIFWHDSARPDLDGKVLLPVLGEECEEAVMQGKLKVVSEGGKYFITYYERRFPVNPATYELINTNGAAKLTARDLSELLQRQHFKLAFWQKANTEINYRRFFDINDLAALRTEHADVFEQSHALIFHLLDEGKIHGLRIDHPDGLYDPADYFRRLQRSDVPLYVVAEKILAADEPLRRDWPIHGTTGYDYINKINGLFIDPAGEQAFTQNYCSFVAGIPAFEELAFEKKRLMLEIAFAAELSRLSQQVHRLASDVGNVNALSIDAICGALCDLLVAFPIYRTYISREATSEEDVRIVEQAVHAVASEYTSQDEQQRRVGVPADQSDLPDSARRWAGTPALHLDALDFLRKTLLLKNAEALTDEQRSSRLDFIARFQQLTAPVTAKGIEDTAFYVYNRLISLNEVGGDPGRFGNSPTELHDWLRDRAVNWPLGLSPFSTHDTKRSEDVRARVNVLSEIPDVWWQNVSRWSEMNELHREVRNGKPAPDRNDEYLIYQALIGAWPVNDEERVSADFIARIQQFMNKAIREAKTHTNWTDPNLDYERGVRHFIDAILCVEKSAGFLRDFRAFQRQISRVGFANSVSQTLLRLTTPGVCDTYQGTEMWDFSLVDPDNRRAVDYGHRETALAEIRRRWDVKSDRLACLKELAANVKDGRIKLLVTWLGLSLRRQYPDLFLHGDYLPVEVTGTRQDRIFSFIRANAGQAILVAVSRFHGIEGWACGVDWDDTQLLVPLDLHEPELENYLTGEVIPTRRSTAAGYTISAGDVFAQLPVALLIVHGATAHAPKTAGYTLRSSHTP